MRGSASEGISGADGLLRREEQGPGEHQGELCSGGLPISEQRVCSEQSRGREAQWKVIAG